MADRTIGDYAVIGRVGAGSMGTVLRVRDGLGRELAMKVLPVGAPDDLARRFRREARALARLDAHPNVVKVHAAGEDDDGVSFYVMDLVPGESLADVLAREGPLPLDRALELCSTIARALHYAHENGLVHRDVKPHNVILGPHGPVVVDFGLVHDALTRASLTRGGQVLGTPNYMPPEQALGERDRIGPPADVYGVGATLHAALTGRPPFVLGEGDSFAEFSHRIAREPVPPVDRRLPGGLQDLLDRALAKDPADRPSSAAALADELDRIRSGEGPTSRTRTSSRLRRAIRRTPHRRRVIALVLFLASVWAGIMGWRLLAPASETGREPPAEVDRETGGELPTEAAAPLDLYLEGDLEAAIRRVRSLEEAGEARLDHRVVLCRALVEEGDLEAAVREAGMEPAGTPLEVVGELARILRRGADDPAALAEGIDDLRALEGVDRALSLEARAAVHRAADHLDLAAEDARRAVEARGVGGDLARSLLASIPEERTGSWPPPVDTSPSPPVPESLREAMERMARSTRERSTAVRRRVLAFYDGELPDDPPTAVILAMGTGGSWQERALWLWAAAERDPVVLAFLLPYLEGNFQIGTFVRDRTFERSLAARCLSPRSVEGAMALEAYYARRERFGYAPLAAARRAFDRIVRERPGVVSARLYRGLCSTAMGYPASGRADIRAARDAAGDDLARDVISLAGAEGLVVHDRELARTLLAEVRAEGADVRSRIEASRPWADPEASDWARVPSLDPGELGRLRELTGR